MRREEGKLGMPGHVSCSWPRASTRREVNWSHGRSLPSSHSTPPRGRQGTTLTQPSPFRAFLSVASHSRLSKSLAWQSRPGSAVGPEWSREAQAASTACDQTLCRIIRVKNQPAATGIPTTPPRAA